MTMKKLVIIFILLVGGFSESSIWALDIVLVKKEVVKDPDRPRSPFLIAAYAFMENDVLSVSFYYPVGIAEIYITDIDNKGVYSVVVNSDFQQQTAIPLSAFENGAYSINIEYDSVLLVGNFLI